MSESKSRFSLKRILFECLSRGFFHMFYECIVHIVAGFIGSVFVCSVQAASMVLLRSHFSGCIVLYRTLPHSVNKQCIIWIYELFLLVFLNGTKSFFLHKMRFVLPFGCYAMRSAAEWVVICLLYISLFVSVSLILSYLYKCMYIFSFIVYLVIFMCAHRNGICCAILFISFVSLFSYTHTNITHISMYCLA